ncbi:MAG: hypothetical protein HY866_16830 [Chloroflexi bacterium]|nr:hypothetical protein [Chloroflexota bacterium]
MSSQFSTPSHLSPRQKSPDKAKIYLITAVVSVVIIGLILYVASQTLSEDKHDTPTPQPEPSSSYNIKPFVIAANTLGIDAINTWNKVEQGDFTAVLPPRLKALSEDELAARIRDQNVQIPDASILLMALDEKTDFNEVNVTITRILSTSSMTPEVYAEGVAAEFNENKYTIEDIFAYQLGSRRVGRVIYSKTFSTPVIGPFSGVHFAYVQDNVIWVITGTALSADFDDWLPIFEVIAREFEIN